MDITVKGKNVEVPEDLYSYFVRKLEKLANLSTRLISVTVNLTEGVSKKSSQSHRVEIIVHGLSQVLKSEEEHEGFKAAFDQALDKIKGQLRKAKTKRIEKSRDVKRSRVTIRKEAAPIEKAEAKPLLYVERYSLKPLSIAEAQMQLEMQSRGFFVFVNNQNVVNCIYQRDDGQFGLFEPEETA